MAAHKWLKNHVKPPLLRPYSRVGCVIITAFTDMVQGGLGLTWSELPVRPALVSLSCRREQAPITPFLPCLRKHFVLLPHLRAVNAQGSGGERTGEMVEQKVLRDRSIAKLMEEQKN